MIIYKDRQRKELIQQVIDRLIYKPEFEDKLKKLISETDVKINKIELTNSLSDYRDGNGY